MRIISSKKDYYDCGKANDQDNSVIFNREEAKEKLPNYQFPVVSECRGVSFGTVVVGFCDKIYLGMYVNWISGASYYHYSFSENGKFRPKTVCYTEEQIYSSLKSILNPRGYDLIKESQEKMGDKWPKDLKDGYKKSHSKGISAFFNRATEIQDKYPQLFKTPIFAIYPDSDGQTKNEDIRYNCMLRECQFERLFDPIKAYQELLMYMNNKAAPEKPIPKITDVEMAESKGFNKYSFRKDKTK